MPNARRRAAIARDVLALEGVPAARALLRHLLDGAPLAWLDQLDPVDLLNASTIGLDLINQPKLWREVVRGAHA